MAGTSNITGDESIIFADNVSFNGTERGGKITTNGQLLIGATAAPHIRVGTLTSTGGTLTITTGAGTINLESGGAVSSQFNADAGSAIPAAGIIQLLGGTNGIDTSAAGNTVTFNFDVTEQPTIPTSFPTPSGTATPALNILTFANGTGISISGAGSTVTVGVNGSVVGQTITGDTGGALSPTAGNWNILGGPGVTTSGSGSTLTINSVVHTDTTATTMAADNGYFATAAGAYVLPAAPAQGEMVIINCDTTGAVAVTANTGQIIRLGNVVSSTAGTATSSARGDSLTMRYRTSGAVWFVTSSIGIWVLA